MYKDLIFQGNSTYELRDTCFNHKHVLSNGRWALRGAGEFCIIKSYQSRNANVVGALAKFYATFLGRYNYSDRVARMQDLRQGVDHNFPEVQYGKKYYPALLCRLADMRYIPHGFSRNYYL